MVRAVVAPHADIALLLEHWSYNELLGESDSIYAETQYFLQVEGKYLN